MKKKSKKMSSEKPEVLKKTKKPRVRLELIILVIIILGGLISVFFSKEDNGNVHKTLEAQEGNLSIPVSLLKSGKAKYFKYNFPDKTIFFFAVKSKDGVFHSAFDACDFCFRKRKGYSQHLDRMACKKCGRRFPTKQINIIKGGCYPSPLKRVIEGENLVINITDLYEGARYF